MKRENKGKHFKEFTQLWTIGWLFSVLPVFKINKISLLRGAVDSPMSVSPC